MVNQEVPIFKVVISCSHFRFSDKQLKLKNLKNSHKIQEEKFEHLIQKHKLAENLKAKIKEKRNNIELLTKLLKEKRENNDKLLATKKKHHDNNRNLRIVLPKYEDKVNKLGDYVCEGREKNDKSREKCEEFQLELKTVRREYIEKLVRYIFPISQIVASSTSLRLLSDLKDSQNSRRSSNDSLQPELRDEIAEAIRTAYIRGRWVSQQESHGELQYIIVAPSIPSNGDYSAYCDWIIHNKDLPNAASNAGNELGSSIQKNQAFRISAALTYTCQLVQALSFYLDVRLPYKLSYSDFCTNDLPEQKFQRRVARLNSNILYLCYTQNIKLKNIQVTHTLENVSLLLDTKVSDLGRIGYVDASERLAESFDSRLMQDLDNGESDSDDENNFPQEWENVSHLTPLEVSHAIAGAPGPSQQTASVAGNLLNAAQQSFASFWRWTK